MKIPVFKYRNHEHGSVLAIGLVIATILGLTLASYLVLTERQHRSMIRSQTWGASLALTEAGVEEALAYINRFVGTPNELSTWTNSLEGGKWTQNGNVYSKTTTVDPALGSYTVYITNQIINTPAIYSVGQAAWKLSETPAAQPYYAAVAVQGVTLEGASAPVVRRVFVQTLKTPLFAVAMAALRQIDLRGNNITTDSFDSADPNYSTNGEYPTGNLSKTKDNGTIITLSTLVDSLLVGNADIKGMVKTGPNGTIAIGSNGSVGSKAWVEGGNNGIEAGYSANDVNLEFPNAVLPNVSWSALPAASSQTINGVTYTRVFDSDGNYPISTLSGKIYIAPGADVRLYVTGSVGLSGSERIDVSGTNASLAIYMAGETFSVAGTASINNLGKNALALALYGLPSCKTINLGGNAAFSGTVYAPQADYTLGGGGNTVYDFVGASVTKSVKMNGHFKFHYDENLARVGPTRGYIPTSWVEN